MAPSIVRAGNIVHALRCRGLARPVRVHAPNLDFRQKNDTGNARRNTEYALVQSLNWRAEERDRGTVDSVEEGKSKGTLQRCYVTPVFQDGVRSRFGIRTAPKSNHTQLRIGV
jgi:hypothetical protein